MDHLNELIAENLKDIRKGKGLSLEQVSSLTTISKSMLSQLERGEVNPTISTVYKLALGLKVPVTAFTADKPQPFFETGKKEVEPWRGMMEDTVFIRSSVSGRDRILKSLTWNLMRTE